MNPHDPEALTPSANAMETINVPSGSDPLSNILVLLKQHRMIASIWSVEDVQSIRPDLTDEQAWQVLQHCDRSQDCESGLTWSFFEYTAETLFPEPGDTSEEDESLD